MLVDDDLMVVPAEGDQIVGVCCSALAPWDEMVDLETMVTPEGLASRGGKGGGPDIGGVLEILELSLDQFFLLHPSRVDEEGLSLLLDPQEVFGNPLNHEVMD